MLSKKNLIIAGKIARKLNLLKNKIKKNYKIKKNINFIKKYLTNSYSIKLDYLELRDEKNLSKTIKNNKFRLFIAYHINNVRLIDNY